MRKTGPESALGVTELTRSLKTLIEDRYPAVWVRGEISNLRKQASGHCYFSLKDAGSQISAVLFRGNALRSECQPEDGRQVLAFGELSVYEPRGTYQIIARELIEDGIGKLQREFERLKKMMRAEGLFDDSRKKALPALPLKVGVITSPSGAAIRDMISVFQRMDWPGNLRIFPSAVQGAAAIPALVRQIERAGSMEELDLLVLARGGGSLEDLWCFNDEKVARALADCPVPTISAIGHETDVVLTDFIADLRKETPTGAAEWVSSVVARVVRDLEATGEDLLRAGQELLRTRLADLEQLRARSVARPFLRQIEGNAQRLDEWQERIVRAVEQGFSRRWTDADQIRNRLKVRSPERVLRQRKLEFAEIRKQLRRA
ncbi:MAG: exodeoxyribonuclease VII large subunit, partial [Puniceicoccales bacterium]